ncbi:MAG: YHS domain-containing protein [Thermoplasmata archaeon]|nr:YHS domain-containing protein [Thermoplasmata archaeon]
MDRIPLCVASAEAAAWAIVSIGAVTVKRPYSGPLARDGADMVKVKDPVCGMMVESEKAPASGVYDGRTVYFCNPSCKTTYEARMRPTGGP